MALPSSGQITFNQVNVELDNTATAQVGLNDSAVRGLFGKSSGQISMSDGYGKSTVPTVIASGTGKNNFGATVNSGDVAIFYNGRMTRPPSPSSGMVLPSGFTMVDTVNASVQWNTGDPNWYEGVICGYKLMGGGETSFQGDASLSNGAWSIIRMPGGAMSSLSHFGTVVSTNRNVHINFPATSNLNTLRLVGSGGYNAGSTFGGIPSGAVVLVNSLRGPRATMGAAFYNSAYTSGTGFQIFGGGFKKAAIGFSLQGS